MLGAASALALALAGVALAAPPRYPLPPGVEPVLELVEPPPGPTLDETLASLGAPRLSPRPRGAIPLPGSATESEALRRYVRARVRMDDGQPLRAAEELDAALRLDPTSAALHRARADASAGAGEVARAISEWEAVLALEPDDLEAALAVGIGAFETGNIERSVAILGRAWKAVESGKGSALNASGRFALGATLARGLLRMGHAAAALAPAQFALAEDVAAMAQERGDGPEATARAVASLARDAGDAALRAGQWERASDLLERATSIAPDSRAEALAALAAVRARRTDRALALLDRMLEQGEPSSEAQALVAEWLLSSIGGSAEVAAHLHQRMQQSPGNGRVARLLAAADPAVGPSVLSAAILQGAVDRATIRSAIVALEPSEAAQLAVRALQVDPGLVRTIARELARSAATRTGLDAALESVPASAEREAIRSAIASFQREPGAAWSVAEAARERWPDEPAVYFALIEAAAASGDPSLVQRALVDAPELLTSDANWHAAIARAALATGLSELASASLARCDALDPSSEAASQIRGAEAGSAPSWSARGRAEQAVARGELREAVAALMEARALDPDDDAALGMLLRVLPRTMGAEGALAWTEAEVERSPNDPLLWEAVALQSVVSGRAAAALARMDTAIARDPANAAPTLAREAVLRAVGQAEAALASARARVAAHPPGPRRALEMAAIEVQAGQGPAVIESLRAFAEGAYPPPTGMRAAALEVLRRVEAGPDRSALMRRLARDAILAESEAPLEFFAFEALAAASDPGFDEGARRAFVTMIAEEAATLPLHRADGAAESWRSCCDFLATQGHATEGAIFARAGLQAVMAAPSPQVRLLARAILTAEALASSPERTDEALAFLAELLSAGLDPFDRKPGVTPSHYTDLAGLFTLAGNAEGSERILEAALALDADDPVAQNNLAYARAQRGVLDARTEDLARRAVLARPDESSHLDTLGWVLYLTGRIKDEPGAPGAVTLLRRATGRAGRGGGAELYLHLGDAMWRTGDRVGAERAWRASAQIAQGLGRQSAVQLYRDALRSQTGLGAVDAERYYEEHDGSTVRQAQARLDAVAAGREPEVTPLLAPQGEAKETPTPTAPEQPAAPSQPKQ